MRRLLLLLLSWLPAHAADYSSSFRPDPGFPATLEVRSPFESPPPGGFMPFEVTIRNEARIDRTWVFQSNCESRRERILGRFPCSVPAEETRTFRLLVPLLSLHQARNGHSNLSLQAEGPGIFDAGITLYNSVGHDSTGLVGLSGRQKAALEGDLRSRLENGVGSSGPRTLQVAALDLEALPEDWRAFTGFTVLCFTAAEWRELPAAARGAISTWVRFGGRLMLIADGPSEQAPLSAGASGFGQIDVLGAGESPGPALARGIAEAEPLPLYGAAEGYPQRWSLAKPFGSVQPPLLAVLLFVVIFGVIIGPVNLYVLAPAGRRARLFWTTPLISLAASLLMLAFILLLDGFGGSGARAALLLSLPEERQLLVQQVQVSRTGLLLGNAFSLPTPSVLSELQLGPVGSGNTASQPLQTEANDFAGGWFRSRDLQAQYLMTALASRGRVHAESSPGSPLTVTSEFEFPLAPFFLVDEDGETVWMASSLPPGVPTELRPTTQAHFENWLKEASDDLGPPLRNQLLRQKSRAGFFAAANNAPMIPTLAGIHWTTDRTLLFGPLAP